MVLPPGLTVEEHALKARPTYDELRSFEPAAGTQEEVLSKHQSEREKHPNWPMSNQVTLRGDKLTAATNDTATVQVFRNGAAIYAISVGDASPINPLRGLWTYDNHWVVEVAHVVQKWTPWQSEIDFDVAGEVIRDGESLNRQHGYQEAFGFQNMNDKPFYFFKKFGRLGISYDGREIPLGYAEIPRYGCCSAAALNPRSAENMVSFFAQRDGIWYYVEVGVFN
jgi:hypothetical protein